ncbi:hypothetical protein [Terricaulis sp.]|uniref:hypothetical protein n=1 Tax=Terricaulis sp. TaxID=2768686 RepID=UPI00378400E0
MSTPTVLVVCPGRGVYTKAELGYLNRFGSNAFIAWADTERERAGRTSVTALDGASSYESDTYTRGDNAAGLIYSCSLLDFRAIDPHAFEVVAICGNSMGWYTALACAGALDAEQGFKLADTMGAMTHEMAPGGQCVHTTADASWRISGERRAALMDAMARAGALGKIEVSIELGAMVVFAGADAAIDAFIEAAPRGPQPFPFRLTNHGAFHTPLMAPISARAKEVIPAQWFRAPRIPIIDGRGKVWRPFSTDPAAIWDYTLGAQVVDTYDFNASVRVAMREYAPDHVIVLGPGDTLGGAVIQSLIACQWDDIKDKAAFDARQARAPLLISMGRADQRRLVDSGGALNAAR